MALKGSFRSLQYIVDDFVRWRAKGGRCCYRIDDDKVKGGNSIKDRKVRELVFADDATKNLLYAKGLLIQSGLVSVFSNMLSVFSKMLSVFSKMLSVFINALFFFYLKDKSFL